MFILDKVMPNGAQARYHKAVRFEVHEDGTHGVISSYHLDTMELISWQDTYVFPIAFKIQTLDDVETLITLPGAPFEGATLVSDDATEFQRKKANIKAALKQARDTAEWSGVYTPLGRVDSDPVSQRKVSGAALMASIVGASFAVDWRMADNSVVTHDHDQIIAMGIAVGQHVAACQAHKNTVDAQVEAALNVEELELLDIETGWPGQVSNVPQP